MSDNIDLHTSSLTLPLPLWASATAHEAQVRLTYCPGAAHQPGQPPGAQIHRLAAHDAPSVAGVCNGLMTFLQQHDVDALLCGAVPPCNKCVMPAMSPSTRGPRLALESRTSRGLRAGPGGKQACWSGHRPSIAWSQQPLQPTPPPHHPDGADGVRERSPWARRSPHASAGALRSAGSHGVAGAHGVGAARDGDTQGVVGARGCQSAIVRWRSWVCGSPWGRRRLGGAPRLAHAAARDAHGGLWNARGRAATHAVADASWRPQEPMGRRRPQSMGAR